MKVGGVIAVLTHKNRPPMADNDKAYKDDVAPEKGSPFRPLYDNKIMFNGQPIALVVAEDSETARFVSSLIRVDYEEEPHVTDLYRKRDDAFSLEEPAKPRAMQRRLLRQPRCATRASITSRLSTTIRWNRMPRR